MHLEKAELGPATIIRDSVRAFPVPAKRTNAFRLPLRVAASEVNLMAMLCAYHSDAMHVSASQSLYVRTLSDGRCRSIRKGPPTKALGPVLSFPLGR